MEALFVNADIITLDAARPRARCLLVRDERIESVLAERPTGLSNNVQVIDCAGACVVPGFHDCHVHLTATGLLQGDRDLSGCNDLPALLTRVASLAGSALVYAGNFDERRLAEERPPKRAELDTVTRGKPALLTRVDGHSCFLNTGAFDLLSIDLARPEVEKDANGDPTGRLAGPAGYAAQFEFVRKMPTQELRRADRAAAAAALAAGVTTLHNVIEGDASYEELAEIYIDNAVLPVRVISKSCTTNVAKAKRLGGRLFGGDIFVDGSIGSRTAALTRAYRDAHTQGLLYLRKDDLIDLFAEAAESGLSLGVHAIGDDAIEQAIAAWEEVARRRGSLKPLRPSIDHFEIARRDHIERAARVGILLSMQPAFDHLWGGEGAMYESRLGAERARSMNLLRTARQTGCTVCSGSDSPVTPLSAILGIHSGVNHHVPSERLSAEEMLRTYTCDAAKLGFVERECGTLADGMLADFTLLDRPLDRAPAAQIKDIGVLMTVVGGEIRHSKI
ncbi:MAG TPA: amidohydrolase [Candidatus Acidoferrales bacterium]|nr:amidohydrolase [Candidatus Acidoferrales bacterium]